MGTAHNGNDYERLKLELRRLKRRSAPWYFESALHQRLHGGRRSRPRLRPISVSPVLAVAFITLCILGLAVYVVLLRTNLRLPGSPPDVRISPDTLSRVQAGDSVLPPPGSISVPARGSSRGAARSLPPGGIPADTPRAPMREVRAPNVDTALSRGDTSAAQRDSASHGLDTTISPGKGGRIE